MPTHYTDTIAQAFGHGSDARLAGKPVAPAPYLDPGCAEYWRKGWRHIDLFWGTDVRGRWHAKPLPVLVGRGR